VFITEPESSKPSYVIILGHALYEPWQSILFKGQLKTWAPVSNQEILHSYGVTVNKLIHKLDQKYWELKWHKHFGKLVLLLDVFFFQLLNRRATSIREIKSSYGFNAIEVEMLDLNIQMNRKSLAVMKYASQLKTDFVVFTTSSSYLSIKNLEAVLSTLPRERLVAGRLIEHGSEKFPSGSFRIFTPDLLLAALADLTAYKSWLPEDLAFGKLLTKHSPNYFSVSSIDLETTEEVNELTEGEIAQVVHYRVKSGTLTMRNDVALMLALHYKILNWKNE
jgi:hypothetical protein